MLWFHASIARVSALLYALLYRFPCLLVLPFFIHACLITQVTSVSALLYRFPCLLRSFCACCAHFLCFDHSRGFTVFHVCRHVGAYTDALGGGCARRCCAQPLTFIWTNGALHATTYFRLDQRGIAFPLGPAGHCVTTFIVKVFFHFHWGLERRYRDNWI